MDRDKLNDACNTAFLWNYIPSATESPDPRRDIFADGFKQGTDWLMQQPLSERLTDEEKEEFKALHAEAALWGDFDSTDNIEPLSHYHGRKLCLEWIFGKDLFIEK